MDFNTEGMIHIGLLPEYIEEVRRDDMSDEDPELLFHTAEVFIQVWEKIEPASWCQMNRMKFYK